MHQGSVVNQIVINNFQKWGVKANCKLLNNERIYQIIHYHVKNMKLHVNRN